MITSAKEFVEEVCFEVCLEFRGAQIIPTREIIRESIEYKINLKRRTQPLLVEMDVNIEALIEKVNTKIITGTSGHNTLEGSSSQHQEWLDQRRIDIENGVHWSAFKLFLSGSISEGQIEELSSSTDSILGSIEDPNRPGKWQSRGLVIGDVQSGKTTNFLGVINKAVDAGYKIIIILSGLHNSLRTQTQKRFEEGVTGFNTQKIDPPASLQCGVALIDTENVASLKMMNLTARDDSGDFKSKRDPGTLLDVDIYSINKKNYSTLTNLIEFLKTQREGNNLSHQTPMLLIDDEADHASINTNKELQEASKINGLIKELLNLFDRHAYIAYTATPFANVLMNPEEEDDLFPRNFITCLGRPDNYIGPEEVFGSVEDDGTQTDNDDQDEGGEAPVSINERAIAVDWFRNLDAPRFKQDWMFVPTRHKKDLKIDGLPGSLEYAIQAFILAVTIRNLRGDKFEHKTMLIHVTRFKDIQNRIHELTEQYIEEIYAELSIKQFTQKSGNILSVFRAVFEEEYGLCEFNWESVLDMLPATSSLVKGHVYAINGDSKDIIDEDKYPNGLTSIRIGGEKLSRGLTLPGLMTNYFIRTSKPYDTLMQMGRWFGYRDNYKDLCRLFITAKLFNWFGHVALASEALRHRVTYMQRARLSPLEFRQEVRSHPGMLLVTAKNKQRHTRTLQVSWNGQLPAITAFDVTPPALQKAKNNTRLVSTLIDTLGRGYDKKAHPQHQIYQGVKANLVNALIEKFSYSEGGGNWEKTTLLKYISDMRQISELTDWTVVLFSRKAKGKETASPVRIGEYNVFPLQRGVDVLDLDGSTTSKIGLKNSALVSLSDEFLDFSQEERLRVEKTGRDKKTGEVKTVREDIRASRPNSRALLLIYFIDLYHAVDVIEHKGISLPALSISFPQSPNGKSSRVTTGLLEGLEDADFEEMDDE
tara:strand:+ start:688 stop:3483 length:2796 start_codon:yes stop_codon:yes gene_type:complete